ncbi:hypothetical protein [Pseudogemmobacter sonorensis]|uniref:hypothetical protein n=1 Tax=Pseudogemmobacter sonorensis TaxID=2989681 RepID=UPI003696362A
MPINPVSGLFARLWHFVDRFAPSETINREDLDAALDDFTPAINAALEGRAAAEAAAALAQGYATKASYAGAQAGSAAGAAASAAAAAEHIAAAALAASEARNYRDQAYDAVEEAERVKIGVTAGDPGVVVKVSDDEWSTRQIEGGSRISVTNGNGVDSETGIVVALEESARSQDAATWRAGEGAVESLISPVKARAAVRAAMNAGETPGPLFACRAWVLFDGTTAVPTILGSGNVAAVTRNGVGDYTIAFIGAMPSANYSIIATAAKPAASPGSAWSYHAQPRSPGDIAAGSLRIVSGYVSGTADGGYNAIANLERISVAIFH